MAKDDDKPKVPAKAEVTYVPGPEGPSEVKWWGMLFRANVARTVTHRQLIESAMSNPFFQVNGERKEKAKPGTPTTPEEYKVHAIAWINASGSHHDLERQWEKEDELREEIGVGTDDLDYILPKFNARYALLKKQAA